MKTFPRGKIYGKEHPGQDKMLDFYDCVPFTRSADKYGYKCPTSLKPNMTIDEYALCKTDITDPKVQAELAKKAGVVLPKKVQYKLKKKSVKKPTAPKSATNSKKKDGRFIIEF